MLKFFGVLLVTAALVAEQYAFAVPTIPIDKALVFRPIGKDGNSWVFNANRFVDAIVTNFKSQVPDSMPLEEIRESYHTKLWIIKIGGKYHLWNGKIWGFKSVHRTGDVKISYYNDRKTLEIAAAIGANQLRASYMGHGEMKPITIDPRIEATIPNLSISAKLCATVVDPIQLRVCGVKVTSGMPKISFHGLNLFNGLADVLSNMFLRNTKPKLIRSAEESLRKMLEDYLKKNRASLTRQIRNLMASGY